MQLTEEQQNVIETVYKSNGEIIAVQALAGTGKTSTANAIIDTIEPKSGFYTAFNKAIVQDSAKAFGNKIEARTIHSLAYRYLHPKEIKTLTINDIKEEYPYKVKEVIINEIDNFYRSPYLTFDEYFETTDVDISFKDDIERYINYMYEGKIPPTFNCLLKWLHIMLYNKEINIDKDLLILDECLTGNTEVNTNKGYMTISRVCDFLKKNIPVKVLSYNKDTNTYEYKNASNPLVRSTDNVCRVITEGSYIECTDNHKFYVVNSYKVDTPEYIEAQNLKAYTHIILSNQTDNPNIYKLGNDDQNALATAYGMYAEKLYLASNCVNYISPNRIKTFYFEDRKMYQYYLDTFNMKEPKNNIGTEEISYYTFRADGKYNFSYNFNELTFVMLFLLKKRSYRLTIPSLLLVKLNDLKHVLVSLNKEYNLDMLIQQIDDDLVCYIHNKENMDKLINKYYNGKNYIKLDNKYKYHGYLVKEIKYTDTPTTVYDFEVEDNHNFIVKGINTNKTSKAFSTFISHNCQDTTAVTLEIFKLINADKKVMLGDQYQNIYSFMNTVNAFELLPDTTVCKLTQSFRCSDNIAKEVDMFGKKYFEDTFSYKGHSNVFQNNITVYLARSKITLIKRMYKLLSEGKGFTLFRDIEEYFQFPNNILRSFSGYPLDKDYMFLKKEIDSFNKITTNHSLSNYLDYLQYNVDIYDMKIAIDMIRFLNNTRISIRDMINKVKARKIDPHIILSTVHAYKGLEADTAILEKDLSTSTNMAIGEIQNTSNGTTFYDKRRNSPSNLKEELNLYYVALSRAKHNIYKCER